MSFRHLWNGDSEHRRRRRPSWPALPPTWIACTQASGPEDLAQVGRAATSIASHPHVSAAERTRIQQILGADLGEFVAGDKRVHDAAVGLAAAAAGNDIADVLPAPGDLESGCVSCRTGFRAQLTADE